MKANHTLSILLAVSTVSNAERQETIPLYNGTPEKIHWELEKNNEYARLAGNIYFSGIDNSSDGYSNWNIPAFDTKGGTRTATGFRINYGATLQGTFHADAGTTHNRKVQSFHRWAGLTADVQITDGLSAYSGGYTTNSYGGEQVDIPVSQQTATLDWNLNSTIQEEGWTLRPLIYPERKSAFADIIAGKGEVFLQGTMFWDPYFTFSRKEIGGNKTVTAYADVGTSVWEIPNENVADQFLKAAYPVDAFGRRIDAFLGLPGYPTGTQPQNSREAIYGRSGASNPVNVSITYFYTQEGDSDHGRTTYGVAGKYAKEFETMDNSQFFFMEPANFQNHNLPGNKSLEYVEFARLAGKPAYTSGIQLYDFTAVDKKDPAYGLNITYHFRWMDADRDGVVSMKEYRNWRSALEKVLLEHSNPGPYLPDADWASVASPPDADVVETGSLKWKEEMLFRALDESGNGKLYKKQWMHLYTTPKKGSSYPADGSFEKVDANNDQMVTREEIAAIPNAQMPLVWRKGLARTELFAELDGKNKGKKDNKLALSELRFAFKPGTKPAQANSTLKRMAGGKLKLPVNLRGFLAWRTVPLTSYETATKIRKIRNTTFYKIRGTFVSTIDRAKFGKLFKKDLPKEKVDKAWMIATNTKKGQQPPATLSRTKFLACRLIGAKIK